MLLLEIFRHVKKEEKNFKLKYLLRLLNVRGVLYEIGESEVVECKGCLI